MKHYHDEWIREWCDRNGWTELFMERTNNYWAFPPGAVMPEPIPAKTLRTIKGEKGFSLEEKRLLNIAIVTTLISVIGSYLLKCPMPIIFAFAFDAITAANLEAEI
jgi:hypothetical protein